MEKIKDDQKYLLFDDSYTEFKSGFETSVNSPEYTGEELLVADQPWERAGLCGDSCVTVLKDGDLHKMWYCIGNPEPETELEKELTVDQVNNLDLSNVPKKFLADISCPSRYYLCYATSVDGVNWRKDKLGLYEVDGNKDNNIVFSGRIGATIFIDPTASSDKKFKMIHGGSIRLPHWRRDTNKFIRMAYTGIYGAYSPDGIKWISTPNQIIPWYTDTTNVCYWDEAIGKYVAYVRSDKDMIFEDGKTVHIGKGHYTYRIISRTESDDFENFPPPQEIFSPDLDEVEDYQTEDSTRPGFDFYNSSAVKYPFGNSTYLMFPSFFDHVPDTLAVHIATSRNGVDYTRYDEPFIGLGKIGEFYARQIYMATGILADKEQMHMYYLAYNTGHDGGVDEKFRKGTIGRVSFRKDGFISQNTIDDGFLTTKSMIIPGDCSFLKVNMKTSDGGFLRCALLSSSTGEELFGKSVVDSDVVTGDHIDIRMSWNKSSTLNSLHGVSVKLRFVGKSVKLYSFEFVAESALCSPLT